MSAIDLFRGKPPDKKPGEIARIKVLKGKDLGSVFVVKQKKITIGRGEGVDVLIQDIKSSRTHATLELINSSEWSINDLGSANGIIHNGKLIRQGTIKSGDFFQIGDTLFEFLSQNATLRELVAPVKPQNLREIVNKKIKEESRVKVKSKKNNILTLAFGFIAVFFLFSYFSENKTPKNEKKTQNVGKGMPQLTPNTQYLKPQKQMHHLAADRLFNQGFREYVEKNYLRAFFLFDQVLNTDPTHKKAQIYKVRSRSAILNEVKKRLSRASLSKEIGKKQEAIEHYEAVKRLLFYEKNHSDYKTADQELSALLREESK